MPIRQKPTYQSGRSSGVDAAGQGHRAAVLPDAPAGQVDRHQRRRAGRVDRARSAPGSRSSTRSGWRRCSAIRPCSNTRRSRRGRGSSSAGSSSRSSRSRRRRPSALPEIRSSGSPASSSASHATSSSSRCCGSIRDRFTRRDPEEVRVEAVDPLDEAAPAAVRLARPARSRDRRTYESQRSAGTSVIASTPASRSLQKTSGSFARPGKATPDADDRRWAGDDSGRSKTRIGPALYRCCYRGSLACSADSMLWILPDSQISRHVHGRMNLQHQGVGAIDGRYRNTARGDDPTILRSERDFSSRDRPSPGDWARSTWYNPTS